MNNTVRVHLTPDAQQGAALRRLQVMFAEACNALAPVVAEQRCWNRVTLHHLAYRSLRARFPQLGSQMACNAIYAVCRAARLVYQHPSSPFNVARQTSGALPRLSFNDECPVYFDRHTLSLRVDAVSIFGLDGRLHCPAQLPRATCERLGTAKLREVVLTQKAGKFALHFKIGTEPTEATNPAPAGTSARTPWPQYVSVLAARNEPQVGTAETTPAPQ